MASTSTTLQDSRTPDNTRIALFISGLTFGGVQRSMLNLAKGLAEKGYQVDLVVPNASGQFFDQVSSSVRLVDIGDWLTRLPWFRSRKRRRAMVSIFALARYLELNQPAVLISASHYVNLAAILGRSLARTNTPIIISQRTHLSDAILNTNFPGGKRPFLGWMTRHFYPKAETIIAVSDGVADDLATCANISRQNIRTIYNPVVTPELIRQSQAPLDHPWYAPGSPPVILGVGRLARQKDFPTLLRAFAQVRANRPARLLILGEGKKRQELEALAKELHLNNDIAFPGFAKNPFSFMANSDVFVLSSAYEGLPGVLIQAMACGCPVVSTECPSGPREILQHGQLGPLVPVGDSTALAKSILSMLDNPTNKKKLMTRADDFSLDRAVDQYASLFSETRSHATSCHIPKHG